ncbi:MAG: hypothetical protein LBQ60_19880 [Bacteroidales bacterium]|jgi:uncharacterized protein involved in exopolysaccharide biosynthesis|nr:hypothetical protein [Bacteroidales bacterium]
MSIHQIFKILYRHAAIIIGCAVFTGVLVLLFTIGTSRKYLSEATVFTGIRTGYTPESVMERRFDNNAANSILDNMLIIVKSRETLKEVSLRLLSIHLMLEEADQMIIEGEHLYDLHRQLPPHILSLKAGTLDETYRNISEIADSDPFLISLLNDDGSYYSIRDLSNVDVVRLLSGDMVKVSYASNDRGVSRNTLELLIDISIRNFRRLNESQTDSVVSYFQHQLELARKELKQAEEKELSFKKANNLVNYDVQTEIVISQREDIMDQIHKEQEIISATEAVLKNIESQMDVSVRTSKSQELTSVREQLGKLYNQLTIAEINGASMDKISFLQSQKKQLEDKLHGLIKDISFNSGNVSGEVMGTEYFNRVVAYEESKAKLAALEIRNNEKALQYSHFLPMGDTLKRIQREINIKEQTYLSALQNFYQSKTRQQNQSMSTLQIIDHPNYPVKAESGSRKLKVVMGGMAGFMIPVILILSIAYFGRKISTPERAERMTKLQVGGIFPYVKRLNNYKNAEIIRHSLADTILKKLYHSYDQRCQKILIISTRPGEGKTVIGNFLSERLIQKGKKTMVAVPHLNITGINTLNYDTDHTFLRSTIEDLVPADKLDDADILLWELPPLISNDYPIKLIRQFNIVFLVCDANREWTNADQIALDSFVNVSETIPYIILNRVNDDVVRDLLGKING